MTQPAASLLPRSTHSLYAWFYCTSRHTRLHLCSVSDDQGRENVTGFVFLWLYVWDHFYLLDSDRLWLKVTGATIWFIVIYCSTIHTTIYWVFFPNISSIFSYCCYICSDASVVVGPRLFLHQHIPAVKAESLCAAQTKSSTFPQRQLQLHLPVKVVGVRKKRWRNRNEVRITTKSFRPESEQQDPSWLKVEGKTRWSDHREVGS